MWFFKTDHPDSFKKVVAHTLVLRCKFKFDLGIFVISKNSLMKLIELGILLEFHYIAVAKRRLTYCAALNLLEMY